MFGGDVIDLIKMTSRVGMQKNAAECEELTGDEEVPGSDSFSYDQASHRSSERSHGGNLNESTNVGVKTVRPRGRGSRAVDLGSMGNKGQRKQCLPRFGPSLRGKTLRPA